MEAVRAGFIEIKTPKFTKKVGLFSNTMYLQEMMASEWLLDCGLFLNTVQNFSS